MTIPEFLDKLKATEGPWVIVNGCIRCEDHCPLTSLATHVCQDADFFELAAKALSVEQDDTDRIVASADNDQHNWRDFDPILREQLLAATVNRRKFGSPEDGQ